MVFQFQKGKATRLLLFSSSSGHVSRPFLQIVIGKFSARNEKLGHEAVEKLKKELGSPNGDKIRFHKLDVTKKDAIEAFRDHLKKEHGGIDILINNAGILINDGVGHLRTLAYCLSAAMVSIRG